MSVTNVSDKNKNLLWAITAGRCEYRGCNTPLYYDILTKKLYNRSYIAHIIADREDGPRGDKNRSTKLQDQIDNLMLLCDAHHRLIDHEGLKDHPEELLLQMKKEHEDRIKQTSSLLTNLTSYVVFYRANIGEHSPPIDFHTACQSLLPSHYPAISSPIELGVINSPLTDCSTSFWENQDQILVQNFNDHLRLKLRRNEIAHVSLFALAPIPLLIRLGTLLNDLVPVETHQPTREPQGWNLSDEFYDERFIVIPPSGNNSVNVALNISLSATISNERIIRVMGDDCDIYTLTIGNPNNDFLKNKSQLTQFREKMREIYAEINQKYGENTFINIFPAMPVATAIELGRVWMPKANMRLAIYDQNSKLHGFEFALSIGQGGY